MKIGINDSGLSFVVYLPKKIPAFRRRDFFAWESANHFSGSSLHRGFFPGAVPPHYYAGNRERGAQQANYKSNDFGRSAPQRTGMHRFEKRPGTGTRVAVGKSQSAQYTSGILININGIGGAFVGR